MALKSVRTKMPPLFPDAKVDPFEAAIAKLRKAVTHPEHLPDFLVAIAEGETARAEEFRLRMMVPKTEGDADA